MVKTILFLGAMLLAGLMGCSEDHAQCQQGWKRCNGVTIQTCDPNTLQWRDGVNCLKAGYDDCAEATVRYADGSSEPPLCQGSEPMYSTCATSDTRHQVWVRDFICVDRGQPGQG